MKSLPHASRAALAFGLAIAVATLGQCGDANGQQVHSTTRAGAGRGSPSQDPQGQDPQGQKNDQQALPPPDALRILISGSMLGHLEPCGCASGQLGGLARRMQHIGEQRTYDLLLEGGDLVAGATELDKLKLFTAAQVLFTMERSYDAVGVGPNDLALPLEEWSGFLLGGPAVATNLASSDEDWPAVPLRSKQVREHEVRIGSLLLGNLPAKLKGDDAKVQRLEPAKAWAAAFVGVDDRALRIVMLHGNDVQIRAVLPDLDPRPDLAIGVDPGYLEPDTAAHVVAGVPLVFAGIRGRVLLDARLWRDGGEPRVACERVPLAGSRTVPGGGGDPAVKDVLLMHRQNVAEMDVLGQMAEQHPTPNGHSYVGSATCGACHPSAMAAWSKSRHAHAWQTLVDAEKDPKRYGWPVTKYPDCVGCHVVGYGQQSGFRNPDDTPGLLGVGCEQCHGPGSAHVQSQGKQQLGIVDGLLPSEVCTRCH
ncbi:MAG TPA: hypothetical protein ENI87_02770, partial [bacterium]|nr:hypothetical protein [bacterium]